MIKLSFCLVYLVFDWMIFKACYRFSLNNYIQLLIYKRLIYYCERIFFLGPLFSVLVPQLVIIGPEHFQYPNLCPYHFLSIFIFLLFINQLGKLIVYRCQLFVHRHSPIQKQPWFLFAPIHPAFIYGNSIGQIYYVQNTFQPSLIGYHLAQGLQLICLVQSIIINQNLTSCSAQIYQFQKSILKQFTSHSSMPPKLKAPSKTQTVKVVVRCRPPNKNQITQKHDIVVQVFEDERRIAVKNPNPEKSNMPAVRDFTFDSVFAPDCKQQSIFEDTALPIIQSVLEGYNGTIFAYGQTGTGKTHTMEGGQGEQQGIVPRAIKYIFQAIEGAAHTKKYLVRTTFLELYNQQLIDLLVNPEKGKQKQIKQLQIHERPGEGIKVYGLSQFVIQNQKQITHKYNVGKSHRVVAETKMNAQSSRSHSIFSIIIENQEQVNGKLMTRAGKLNLVDLAGSERQSKTGVTGIEREQAININLSLTTLGLVIQTLVNPKATHIPYRDSKLTRLLQDSLGGNTKTVMIANVGPSAYNYDETVSTLKYANRAKNIKNDVRINEDPKDALLRQFQEQIKRLREQVAQSLGGQPGAVYEKIIEEQDVEGLEQNLRNEQEVIKRKFEQQKAEIYKNKAMLQEEKNRILKEIEEKEKEQQLYKQNQQALIKKLKKMEEKVLHGNEEEEAALQKADQLKRKLKELEERRQKQRQIQQDLKEKEDIMDNANKMYKSLQEENEDKSLQIKQKLRRLKNLQNENKELEEMYGEEIEALQQRRRILQKELKLKNFVIDYFVPAEYIEMIHSKVIWNEELDDWFLPNLDISGNSIRHKNPETFNQEQQLADEQLQEIKLNQFVKLQLDNHPNVYYTYSEEGLVRQLEPDQKKPKKAKKRPQSKKKG